jgi:hypothetical protein
VTFVTSRGRRAAAVVSAAAEQAAVDGKASHDAITATSYAVNLQMLPDPGVTPSLSPAECFQNYADDLQRELSGSSNQALAAARAVAAKSASADETGYPTRWRHVALAVELCQRAAEMTGQVLPGSYRPGSRVATPPAADADRCCASNPEGRPFPGRSGESVPGSVPVTCPIGR